MQGPAVLETTVSRVDRTVSHLLFTVLQTVPETGERERILVVGLTASVKASIEADHGLLARHRVGTG